MQAVGVAIVCFAAAAVDGMFAGQDMLHLIHGFTTPLPVISSAHYALASLFLTPMAVGIGLMFLLSRQATPAQMKAAANSPRPGARRFLLFIAGSLVAALIAPIPQFWTVDTLARRRGYVGCPALDRPHHQPDRWAVPGHCPGPGADPNS
ncbi:hypothetical protein [Sphingomonas bacterium]|uniref:hypothetical protein n=1 Tax=Sphingomonas bacterium TaxID=1895847 RepID=UPI001575BE83|nr:hypothetical protein [Sphingomonas bacterium]